MKKRKGFYSWLTALLLISMIASGCSSGSEGKSGTSAPGTGGDDGKKVEILLGYYSSDSSDAKMKELIEQFEKQHPNIKVKTQSAPYGQFYQKLDTQIAAGQAPDVWLSDGVYVMKYAQRGAAKDLTDWIAKDLKADEYYGLDFNKDADGRYWGVPQGIQVGVLFYNKDLFDKAGVAYPSDEWTWEDLKSSAAKLTVDAGGKTAEDSGFDAASVNQFGLTFFSITEGWFSVMKSYGGGALDEKAENSIIHSPENKQAFEWMVDGMQRGIITDPVDLKSFQSNTAVFPSGSAAMRIGIYARVQAANEAGLNYDVALLPKGPDGKRVSPVIANSWVINQKSGEEKAAAAWEWIKYWATEDEVQKQWTELGEAVPVKKSVAESEVFLKAGEQPANRQAFLDSLEFAQTLDNNAVWEEWVGKFNENAERAFLGDTGIDQALSDADAAVQAVLDDFYKK
ncbi:sugar ABC transporter substrate-binding protein [Paenibacillus glucanolyticus]|uniref:ABC transporter substrate-binding protein n=1 Tax=Paenibacillus TaxID=44249 RepID=UPI0003E28FCB|nr:MULTISPECIES: sugar ABC transporter substrate-binding protein [Paenibacillus]ANA81153.1 ABC transporter substrate-binding protein [Paenibacillus glucanolyticus]AVV54729.1 sugar ABC transporter substrate-binding protein [Paenibacillus glucanolyticus]ETT35926.1 family 1 extracellular solute-binding protein [Paenibacillus sp. FSL R5-808]